MRTPPTLAIVARITLAAAVTAGCAAPGAATAPAGMPSPVAVATVTPTIIATPPLASPTARPTQEVGRVGVLDPGSYRYSQRDPAVTFAVPTGWLLTEAMPLHFGLRPDSFLAENSVRIWYDMRVASRDPSCPEEPDPNAGHTASDLADAFQRRPGVRSSGATEIMLGGLEGQWFDLRVDEAWTETCPFTDGTPATTLFTDDLVPDDPAFWGLAGFDEVMRLIVLDDGADSNIVVTIDAVDETTFEALVAAAMPVLETFRFASAS